MILNDQFITELTRSQCSTNGGTTASLRELHIGNGANDPCQNAKLLSELVVDGNVIYRGYYHIVACPMWEDAGFYGSVLDELGADWTTTSRG